MKRIALERIVFILEAQGKSERKRIRATDNQTRSKDKCDYHRENLLFSLHVQEHVGIIFTSCRKIRAGQKCRGFCFFRELFLSLMAKFNLMAICIKSIFQLLLVFVMEFGPSVAFQNSRSSPMLVPAQAPRVHTCCLGTKAVYPRLFAMRRTPHQHQQTFVFDVRRSLSCLKVPCKAVETEHDESTASSAQSEVMKEFVSLYQVAIDAGTFIKCTLSANKGEDR
jgi:hypothetical protein